MLRKVTAALETFLTARELCFCLLSWSSERRSYFFMLGTTAAETNLRCSIAVLKQKLSAWRMITETENVPLAQVEGENSVEPCFGKKGAKCRSFVPDGKKVNMTLLYRHRDGVCE